MLLLAKQKHPQHPGYTQAQLLQIDLLQIVHLNSSRHQLVTFRWLTWMHVKVVKCVTEKNNKTQKCNVVHLP